MAKLHNYYVLCPLIDQKSFLGVEQDIEADCVLVTLGRNVVNKYRLSDQKQVGGWTSKDHITSTVIYDRDQGNYVGVFNKNTIKMWKEDSSNLDRIKKYKFPLNIHKLIQREDQSPLIIFSDGNCASLTYALENRKTYESKPLIKDTETIIDIAYYSINKTNHICYVIKNNKDSYEIVTCPLREELGDMEKAKLTREKITRVEDVIVVGQLINTMWKNAIYVLWNDSKITVYDLVKKSWKTIGTVPWISTRTSVSMAWMGKNHLILFGSNVDQDGAIIIVYNIILGVGSCRYPMKMYTENAKLTCLNSRIILEASNHIGMLPYVLETKRNLSRLLGSHEIIQDESTVIANWGIPTLPNFKVSNEVSELLKGGLTERSVCAQVIPPLIEKNEFRHVFDLIKQFKDVPESVLVMLLNYAVKLLNCDNIDVTNAEEFAKLCSLEGRSKRTKILQRGKLEFLNYIFQIPFSDALVIPHLRNGLALSDTLFVLTYISHVLVDQENDLTTDYESKLFDWCMLIMDAFYQQYLMTKDDKVAYVLDNTTNTVMYLINQLNSVSEVLPQLDLLISGKVIQSNEDLLSYTIELMQI